jgi:conjugative relaxase-like TrwC/TraI family protein
MAMPAPCLTDPHLPNSCPPVCRLYRKGGGSGEAPGYWSGEAAATLGLSGRVEAEQLRAVLAAVDPVSGEELALANRRKGRLPGFDLTFSAPKSVSLLFALGDDDLAATMRAAHDSAVRQALGYLEREAGHVRRGKDGVDRRAGGGFVAAEFRHRTSRAGDPHLHTHVLTANLTRGEDGRWSALDGRALYRHAKTAGTLYRAALRHELRELGLEWSMRANGLAEVAGVTPEVLREFSRRRIEIEQRLDDRGQSSARAAQVATLDTRQAKDYGIDPASLAFGWHQRADALGFTETERLKLLGRAGPTDDPAAVLAARADRLLSPTGLTEHASSFTRQDVLRAWCGELPSGAPVAEVEQLADALLGRPQAVALNRVNGDSRGIELRFSTVEMLATEQAVIDSAASRVGTSVGQVGEHIVDQVVRRRGSLGDEQAAMVRQLLSSGNGVDVVVGVAGSGKTFASDACREGWQAAGHPVLGTAVAARAAAELQDGAGIRSFTLTKLRTR